MCSKIVLPAGISLGWPGDAAGQWFVLRHGTITSTTFQQVSSARRWLQRNETTRLLVPAVIQGKCMHLQPLVPQQLMHVLMQYSTRAGVQAGCSSMQHAPLLPLLHALAALSRM